MDMKNCNKCKIDKPTTEFYKDRRKKDGLAYYCKECSDRLGREWYLKNKDKVLRKLRERYAKDPVLRAKRKVWHDRWYEINGKRHIDDYRMKQYGISPEEYESLFERQGKCCAICKNTPTGKRSWYLDHDHANGDVRGILCRNCNLLLGYAKDSTRNLQGAIAYLANPPAAVPDPLPLAA